MRYEPWVAVISAGRPARVGPMTALLDGLPAIHWYVPAGQGESYRAYGAVQVHEVLGGLSAARNAALDDATGALQACLQVDDDLQGVRAIEAPADLRSKRVAVRAVVAWMGEVLAGSNGHLVGLGDQDNTYFVRRGVSRAGYCNPAFMLVAPSVPRFDQALGVKEGYDFTAQHLHMYGVIARLDRAVPVFSHPRTGGLVGRRSAASDDQAIAYLMAKWPGVFHPHPRRPGEVVMHWETSSDLRRRR